MTLKENVIKVIKLTEAFLDWDFVMCITDQEFCV